MPAVSRWMCGLLLVGLCVAATALPRSAGQAAGLPEGTDPELLRNLLQELILGDFVEITPGKGKFPRSFSMGSANGPAAEQPVHVVKLDYNFHIAKGEVPQYLYAVVMGSNPSQWKGPRNSAEKFTFDEALEFCRRLTALLQAQKLIGADEVIRLPTEAEWEYCCRAGTMTAYSFGDLATKPGDAGTKASLLDEFGWHTGNAAGNDPPVGAKKPNPWGLYDMHGYLSEFVADAWHENYDGAPTDGSAWKNDDAGSQRVIRSGSWKDHHEMLKSTTRRAVPQDIKDDAIGFRCVRARR
ncbi:MAG: formylglycine-generating enzyme family protein [Planctomycetales bacterium]